MARRKARVPQGKSLQPAVTEMIFNLPAGTRYLSISQVASLVNRRFYRAGLNWAVASMEVQAEPNVPGTPATGKVLISKIPQTWIASNSWQKSFSHWNEMNAEALQSAESVKPKFNDFKVYMDADHHALGVDQNLMPLDHTLLVPPVKGEWEMSTVTFPTSATTSNATDFELIWTGASYPGAAATSGLDAVSMIEGYAASRGLPPVTDPNTPDDASDVGPTATPENWIGALTTEGTEQDQDVLTNLLNDNDQAPYPFENAEIPGAPGTFFTDTFYPNGANQLPGPQPYDRLLITSTTVGGSDTAPGTNVPGGLLRFDSSVTGGSLKLILRLLPGTHRGYLAQPMQDM